MAVTDSGTLHHVCFVVRDLDKTAANMVASLGIGPWGVWTIRPQASTLHGRSVADMSFRVAIAQVGDSNYELIEPISQESVYVEHLNSQGEGFHHTCISYQSHDALRSAKAELLAQGHEMIQSGDLGEMGEFCYFDVPETGFLELLFLTELPDPDKRIG